MMLEALPTILAPLLVVVVVAFLIYRFGFFSGRDISGRFAFVSGGLLLLLATGFEVVKLAPTYGDWFVPGAYAVIDLAGFLTGALGLLLLVVGLALYADFWQVRREEVDERFGKLSILENLHHDARQPYHLLEQLDISLREVLVHYPMSAGAVFLVNRTRRQFVLTGSSGLRKEEIAYLEYYPLERNVVSQAVELGDPMLVSRFDFIDRSGRQVASRFRSVLILPLVSGMEKIGGLLLFSEEARFFGREDIRYLSPVAQWLAEKIKSARLSRELTQAVKQRDDHAQRLSSLVARLGSSARAAVSPEAMEGFCRALVGLAGSESVHLCAVRQGSLVFLGGSEPLFDLSENFRTALIDGMGRTKPLIINQEAAEDGQPAGVIQSSLIYPLCSSADNGTMLLIKTGGPFVIDDSRLKLIDSFARLAGLIINFEEQQRSRLTRRKGFDAILRLLQAADDSGNGLNYFIETLHSALPRNTFCLALVPDEEQVYRSVYAVGKCSSEEAAALEIEVGEGGLGAVVSSRECLFVYDRGRIGKHLELYHDQSRSVLQRLFGERGLPDVLAYSPVTAGQENPAVVMVGMYGLAEGERGEWERLITLAAGLYTLRQTLAGLADSAGRSAAARTAFRIPADLLNQLNNHLSAVIGTAELAEQNDTAPENVRRQLRLIMERAEQAADLAKRSLTATESAPTTVSGGDEPLNQVIESELARHHVSGDLYMAGQRPREIRSRLNPAGPIDFSSEMMRELFRSVLNRFASVVDDTDIITVATYTRGDHVYLDVSRHRPNFPPVEKVAGFGRYTISSEAFRNRPADIYLRHLRGSDSYYAVDTTGAVPAFLSFKFPLAVKSVMERPKESSSEVRLLAIDDQSVILDLISAMGRSLGYNVCTASTGEEGLKLVEQGKFDLILTDLALPGISGLEVARHVHRRLPGVPIILVTGWTTEMEKAELLAAGISEVLYKPFRIEQLTAIVQSVVARRITG